MRSHSLTVERASTSAPCSSNSVDHRGMALRDGPHQRRLAFALLARVDVGAALDAAACAAAVLPPRATTISAVWPSAFGEFDVGAGVEQRREHGDVRRDGGFRHRRRAVVVGDGDVRAGLEQARDEVRVVVMHGPVQRRRAVGLGLIRIGAFREQCDGRRVVVVARRVDERASAPPRYRRRARAAGRKRARSSRPPRTRPCCRRATRWARRRVAAPSAACSRRACDRGTSDAGRP